MIGRLVVLGAKGDLMARYLLPALARLQEVEELADDLEVVGAGRDDLDTDGFRSYAADALDEHGEDIADDARKATVERLTYHRADATKADELKPALGDGPCAAYLALPPQVFADAIRALTEVGLPEGSRVVVEKPFGEDLGSARDLNHLLHETFPEEAVFRVDHFLAMRTVQNVLALRAANRIFEAAWSREHVEGVEIVWDETLTLEGRAGYYDSSGALKDMVQNHLLQLLCMVAMEPPLSLEAAELRDAKVELLRAVRAPTPEEAEVTTVRARYTQGRIGDRDVPSYVEEEDVDPERETETFASVTLFVENGRWEGVPFVLRTGKALAGDRQEVVLRFRAVRDAGFCGEAAPEPNVLRLPLSPERMVLAVNVAGRGEPFTLEAAELEKDFAAPVLPAYARLLLDILRGDATLSIRDDEAEESWRIVDPILEAWRSGRVPMREYAAGSGGP